MDKFPATPDQRRSERYDTHLNAHVTNNWQEQCQAVVTDISREGVRIEGSRELVDKVFPNFNADRTAEPQLIQLQMALQEGVALTDENSVAVECSSIYVLRVKRDWFQVGLCYRSIKPACESRLESFIHQLENAPSVYP